MTKFTIGEKEFEMIDSYSEMKLGHWKKFHEAAKESEDNDFEKTKRILLALTNCQDEDIDELPEKLLEELGKKLSFLHDKPELKFEQVIKINSIDYVAPEDMNNLTLGEMSSLSILENMYPDQIERLPYTMSVLVRPGSFTIKNETGKVKWKQGKFNSADIEDRKNIFLEHMPLEYAIALNNFFLSSRIK